jgi:steroid 5-alpha reductase family enzyme
MCDCTSTYQRLNTAALCRSITFLCNCCYCRLPLYAINFPQAAAATAAEAPPFTAVDVLLTCVSSVALLIAYFADTQLSAFTAANAARAAAGQPRVLVLKTGLWRYRCA